MHNYKNVRLISRIFIEGIKILDWNVFALIYINNSTTYC